MQAAGSAPMRRAASRNTSGSGLWRVVSSAATIAANQSDMPSVSSVRTTSRRTLPDAIASGPWLRWLRASSITVAMGRTPPPAARLS